MYKDYTRPNWAILTTNENYSHIGFKMKYVVVLTMFKSERYSGKFEFNSFNDAFNKVVSNLYVDDAKDSMIEGMIQNNIAHCYCEMDQGRATIKLIK